MPLVPDAPDEPIKTVHFPKTLMATDINPDAAIWAKRAKHWRRIEVCFALTAILLVLALLVLR